MRWNHQLDDLVFGAGALSSSWLNRFCPEAFSTEDPAKKLWIGNIPEEAKWKDLQALVDKAETLQTGGFTELRQIAPFGVSTKKTPRHLRQISLFQMAR